MATKERISQFIDFKQISKRKFCAKAGVSHTLFNTPTSISSDNLEKISSAFPELNMDWAINERGEMLFQESQMIVGTDDEAARIAIGALKDQVTELQAKLISCMESKEKLVIGYLPSVNEPLVTKDKVE